MRRILIFGATSAIAQATARLFAAHGATFFLVARHGDRLQAVADDLLVRGAAQVATAILDASDYDRHPALIEEIYQRLGELGIVLIAHGSLADQKACERSFEVTRREFETNALSVISLLTHLANRLEQQGHGTLSVISSVAGDRGRQSNYVYGAAKAAVTTFMEGLRNRLYKSGVHVLTIKPGLVDSPMTARFPKGFLWTRPEVVARGIHQAIEKRKDVVYLPWFWYLVMGVIRALPEAVSKKMRL
ncbi:MAG: SDR family oxidoreductase [Desulfobacterales bacterium]|nr:MAG: SDR family oxidoreductase [Desulfobacterales bacterium]